MLPETDEKAFEEEIRKRLKNENIKIKVIKSTPKNRPSSNSNIFHRNLKSAILEKYPEAQAIDVLMPNINDMGYFRAIEVPAYGSIPINLTKSEVESIHGLDERMPVRAVYDNVLFWEMVLKALAGR